MSYLEVMGLFNSALIIAVGLIIFVARSWLKSFIESQVKNKFDERIEKLRSEFRANEEKLKSDLRAREGELSVLREKILGGRANRDSLVDARRLKAVERAWESVVDLAPFKAVAATMAVIKVDKVVKSAPTDAKLQKFFGIIVSPIPDDKIPEDSAKHEQLFLSPLTWAYLSAYRTVILSSYAKAKGLSMGVDGLDKLMPPDNLKKYSKQPFRNLTTISIKMNPKLFTTYLTISRQNYWESFTKCLME